MTGVPGSVALLDHLNRLLIHATDLRGVVDAALDLVLTLGAHNVAIYLYDRSLPGLTLAGERNHPASLVSEWQWLPLTDETLLTRAVRTGQLQWESDLASATELPRAADSARRTGFRAAVAVPLIVEELPVGALGCGFQHEIAEDDSRITALRLVAQGVAIAVLHARLAEEARRREADQVMLAEATKLFNNTLDLHRTLRDVTRSAALAVGDACMIFLLDRPSPYLSVAASFHRDPAMGDGRLDYVAANPPRIDEGLIGEIIRTGRPLMLSDPPQVYSLHTKYLEPLKLTSWLGAPIIYRGEILGVLTVSSTTAGARFGEREIQLAVSLADSAAPAIANARLFRQLTGEHAFVQAILDNLPEGVVIAEGRELRLTIINRAGRELLGGCSPIGLSLNDWLGHCVFSDSDGHRYTVDDHPLARASRGEATLSHEMVIHAGEREVAVLGNFAPVRDAEGEVIAAVAVMQDISRRRELDQEKDDFLAVAAHELRTPLTLVRGQLQLIERRDSDVPDDIRGRLAIVRDQAERMAEMATRLLDVSRIGLGRLDLMLGSTDLCQLARRMAERFGPRSTGHTIVVRAPTEPVVGRWDRSRLEEVFINLLDNAIRYSPNDGEIAIEVNDNGDAARFAVHDHGIGIAPEDQPRLFERYTRPGRGAEWTKGGMGLGLFICRTLVDAHGGSIDVHSKPGVGTTFVVALPKNIPSGQGDQT